jgi:UPF0755 protein
MKFLKWLFISLIFVFLLTTGTAFYYLQQYLAPVDAGDTSKKLFYVNAGSSLNLILKKLESDKFIKSYIAGRIYTELKGKNKKPQPGNYQLSKSMSFEQIFNKITSGDIYQEWITIPEGFSIRKIAARLDKKAYSGKKYIDMVSTINDASREEFVFLDRLSKSNTMEGYLFPDTYDLAGGKENDLVQLQLKRFENTIYSSWLKRPANWHMTLHETLTLASIVELEAQKPSERKLIAGVFMNRLATGMTLGSDPTVEYALGWHQGDKGLSYNDVKIKSAYNTYINKGLPPGPIANPGLAAFNAVLDYDRTPYLYFVAKGDGSHVFTKSYPEHLRAQSMIIRGLIR